MTIQPTRIPQGFRGVCNICGQEATFADSDPTLYREALLCSICNTTSRYRSIARGVLRAINELTGVAAQSLAELCDSAPGSPIAIYDTQLPFYYALCAYPIPDLLARCDWIDLCLSSFSRNHALGFELDSRTTNQNLEQLTFSDNHFDLLITSDVMEHVRLDFKAHNEIARVLKPGGVYIFTVPHQRVTQETLVRVAIVDPSDPSKDEFPMAKQYHGDANSEDNAALCYREYGTDLDGALTALGFTVEYTCQDFPETGIVNTELFYCRLGPDAHEK